MPLHKQHHLQSARLTCLPLLRRNQRGAGFLSWLMCLLPVVQAARPCPAVPESFNFIPGGGLHTCDHHQKMTGSNLVRDMSALLLLCHQACCLASSASRSSRLTRAIHDPAPGMRRTAQGWPQSAPPEKSHPGFAVNKTGDDMKPDTQENTHIPVISSRGKENLRLLTC